MSKNILVALAWPYANGNPHLGHVSSLMAGDVIARYHRMKGDKVLMVSGSDCYGTPIALEAMAQGTTPDKIAQKYHQVFSDTLINGLNFSYDLYTKTMSEAHHRVVQEVFLELLDKGLLYPKTEQALYSPYLQKFLPDRFVEGVCPKCGFDGARGDQCDECGSLLEVLELGSPRVSKKILGKDVEVKSEDLVLEVRESEHFFLKLSAMQDELQKLVDAKGDQWNKNAVTFAKGFLKQGLKDRAVTRDTDWGVPIPLEGYEDKRIYVWFEAVIGYYSASRTWADSQSDKEVWKEFWQKESAVHYYVHGKDNIPFHTIIWPAMLLGVGNLHTPDKIISSEYLTLEGKQLSKSRNWAVWVPEFLESFDADFLRYYLIANGPETSDADFVWKEFQHKVNGELIGTFGNLVNRVLTFVNKNFDGKVDVKESELSKEAKVLRTKVQESYGVVGRLIENGNLREALREIMELATDANRFIDEAKPWTTIKTPETKPKAEQDLAVLVYVIGNLAILLEPFIPASADKLLAMLGFTPNALEGKEIPISQEIKIADEISPLFAKIEDETIASEVSKLG
jgi:methionyl-tRNA synthetase